MDALPDYVEEMTQEIEDSVGNFSYSHGSSTSTIIQNGKKIVIKTVDGKTTIKMNGKEYVEKDKK